MPEEERCTCTKLMIGAVDQSVIPAAHQLDTAVVSDMMSGNLIRRRSSPDTVSLSLVPRGIERRAKTAYAAPSAPCPWISLTAEGKERPFFRTTINLKGKADLSHIPRPSQSADEVGVEEADRCCSDIKGKLFVCPGEGQRSAHIRRRLQTASGAFCDRAELWRTLQAADAVPDPISAQPCTAAECWKFCFGHGCHGCQI